MQKCEIWCVLRNETCKGNLLVYCKTLILIQARKTVERGSFLGTSYLRQMARSGPKKATASTSLA